MFRSIKQGSRQSWDYVCNLLFEKRWLGDFQQSSNDFSSFPDLLCKINSIFINCTYKTVQYFQLWPYPKWSECYSTSIFFLWKKKIPKLIWNVFNVNSSWIMLLCYPFRFIQSVLIMFVGDLKWSKKYTWHYVGGTWQKYI